jgi:hypothetical protein
MPTRACPGDAGFGFEVEVAFGARGLFDGAMTAFCKKKFRRRRVAEARIGRSRFKQTHQAELSEKREAWAAT